MITEWIFLYVQDLVPLKVWWGRNFFVNVPDCVGLESLSFIKCSFLQHSAASVAHHFNHLLGNLIDRVILYITVKPADMFQLE